ncbi:MAG: hypothetical protein OEM82_03695 [Acidobacteriota bacterium]|nr:hypothetical protein [Acidobacteriota bacterium]
MIIDELLPDYDVSDRYHIDIDALPEDVWQALWTSNLCESPVVSWLFWLRGLPSSNLTLSDISELKFKIIGEEKEKEVVFGLIGEFWSPRGSLQDFDPGKFKEFDTIGFAKCAWSFSLEPTDSGTKLTTETRVQVLGKTSREHFDIYWAFVRPFSGWTRKEILATVKRKSE